MCRALVIGALVLISIGPIQSNASLLEFIRTLAQGNTTSATLSSGSGGNVTAGEPVVEETCETVSTSCRRENMTACLMYPKTGPQGLFLLVMNDGESLLKGKIVILPANNTLPEIQISSHQTKKINISAVVSVDSSIVINTQDGDCKFHTGAPGPQINVDQRSPSYDAFVTPINGAYVLVLIAATAGVIWACCKFGKGERHVDGVPYQELEMGNPTTLSSTSVEVAEVWDKGWDDKWDEGEEGKSPGENHMRSKPSNGKLVDSNGWGNDWDD